eukprot:424694_1
MKANKFWEITYDIKYGTLLSLSHVIAILFYCNYSQLCCSFSETFRRLNNYESDILLIKRHCNFHHFGKLLREIVEVFGINFHELQADKTFYHGINIEMYFKSFYAKICGPMSTTIDIEIAGPIFAGNDGIVITLKNNSALTFYFNCEQFSQHLNEKERLFIGGFSLLPIINIRRMKNQNT